MQKKNQPASSFNQPEHAARMYQSAFAKRVYAVVAHIHKGETMTYKQVAAAAGKPKAARAVGMIMSKNYNPKIPCHRVVRSDGRIGGYNRGGIEQKRAILASEKT